MPEVSIDALQEAIRHTHGCESRFVDRKYHRSFWRQPDIAELMQVVRCVMGASNGTEEDDRQRREDAYAEWFPQHEAIAPATR